MISFPWNTDPILDDISNSNGIVNDNDNHNENKSDDENEIIPFVVEIITLNTESIFREISALCIDVFFNENTLLPEGVDMSKASLPTKGLQLAYLRNMQYSDLRGRMFFGPSKNTMIVARRVKEIPSSPNNNSDKNSSRILSLAQKLKKKPSETPLDFSTIYNAKYLPSQRKKSRSEVNYIAGEVLGFCEVSERRFGFAPSLEIIDDTNDNNDLILDGMKDGKVIDPNSDGKLTKLASLSSTELNNNEFNTISTPLRPLLTNLAVQKKARKSGIGSQLLAKCEEVVTSEWDPPHKELCLQVEEDNPNAISFYEKRGYQILYSDKSSRRFDTTGLFLRQVRTTKVCMRKNLVGMRAKRFAGTKNWVDGVSEFWNGMIKNK